MQAHNKKTYTHSNIHTYTRVRAHSHTHTHKGTHTISPKREAFANINALNNNDNKKFNNRASIHDMM